MKGQSKYEDDDDVYIGIEDEGKSLHKGCRTQTEISTAHCGICSTLDTLTQCGLDFATVPLDQPDYSYFFDSPCFLEKTRKTQWNTLFIGMVRSALEKPSDMHVLESAAKFIQHHGMTTLLVPPVARQMVPHLARCINAIIRTERLSIWYMVPWKSWGLWSSLRTMCGHHPMLGVCPVLHGLTEITKEPMQCLTRSALKRYFGLPIEKSAQSAETNRWLAEPVRMLSLCGVNADEQIPTKQLIPFVLRKTPLLVRKPHAISCREIIKKVVHEKKIFLEDMTDVNATLLHETANAYHDGILLAPLRPLQENLENQVYEAFEKDPVKYDAYTNAIARAMERFKHVRNNLDSGMKVAVLGAGRGPLVQCALEASVRVNCPIETLHIVEKNVWAHQTLRKKLFTHWQADNANTSFSLHKADIRCWKPEEPVDLTISELLGSFGCNEASPECLTARMQGIQSIDGMQIPAQYGSYLSPIQSGKAYEAILQMSTKSKNANAFERIHIVNFRDAHFLSDPQYCFGFDHTDSASCAVSDSAHDRYTSLQFIIQQDGILHGFAGQFDCTLFDGVKISTVEGHQTPGLLSWYRAFFPLKTPLHVNAYDKVVVHVWRRSTKAKLWYEWALEAPQCTEIANSGGKIDSVDLHCDA